MSYATTNNQPVTIVTYELADNGSLDLDTAVGTITDPVGLGSVAVGAPNTGLGGQQASRQ